MTAFAPTLEAFFVERLINQKDASPRTIAAYRDTLRLLLRYASERTGKQPSKLDFADLDASLISGFLDHLQRDRGNSARTRNARLAAIHSLYRFAALRHPEHAQAIARVIEIPTKRHTRPLLCYLDPDEIKALLAAPNRASWLGRRDHALLLTAIQTGLRVSEITSLRIRDLSLNRPGAHCRVIGKGRKARSAALTAETVTILRDWCGERQGQSRRSRVPDTTRRTTHAPRGCLAGREAHHDRCGQLSITRQQARHPAHAQAYQRDAAESQGSRPPHDRALARPREHHLDRGLPACRQQAQAAGNRADRADRHSAGPLPAKRRRDRVPRPTLIMRSVAPANPPLNRGSPTPCQITGCVR
jgi:integrase/recombinase XerD